MENKELAMLQSMFRKEMSKAIESIKDADKKAREAQRNYFKDTETLLYSYPSLKIKIAQDEEDLSNEQIPIQGKSKDIVRYSSNVTTFKPLDNEEIIHNRIASLERTKREVKRIEAALETVKDDKYYQIIPLKYWEQLDPGEIAEKLRCDERTYRRNKNRLINKLKIVLFGADAL